MSLLELIGEAISGDAVKQIGSEIGADEQTTQNAVSAALPMLMGAIAKNAEQPQGAEQLLGMISNDGHDGGILENIGDLISGGNQSAGAGILQQVLGGNQARVESGISKSSGLSSAATGKLMSLLAPLLMGAVGKQQRQNGFSAGDLGKFLGKEREQIEKQSGFASGMFGKMFDTDGDGDLDMKDLLAHGSKMLFKR